MSPVSKVSLRRLYAKIVVDRDTGCWNWQGAKSVPKGYGVATVQSHNVYVHRAIYETVVGPIPDGLQIDHLCRNRKCCAPDHLEPVTNSENKKRARWSHCSKGHPMTEDNLYFTGERRTCKTCHLERDNEYKRRKRS